MSTKSLAHDGLHLTPSASGGNAVAKLWARARRVAAAISEGRDAEFAYRQLVARGVTPDRAARLVLTDVLGHK